MPSPFKSNAASILIALILSGCTNIANTENNSLSESDDHSTALASQSCQSYGFRNWSLSRSEGALTVRAEANLPTPAWKVVLHQSAGVDNGDIRLVMETIEPPGFSNSVVTWVSFEKNVATEAAIQIDVSVVCGTEVVWNSSIGTK